MSDAELPPLDDERAVVASAAAIIEVFDRRPDLYLAAAANPVLALRDAGVRLAPDAERYVERRCRFDPDEADELDALVRRIVEVLGPLDPDDDAAVAKALRGVGIDLPEIELPAEPADARQRKRSSPSSSKARGTTPDDRRAAVVEGDAGKRRPPLDRAERRTLPLRRSALDAAATLPQVSRWRQVRRAGPDPLERVRDEHDVVPLLIEYRERSATQLRFAPPELYERLKATKGGQLSAGINISIRVRLTGQR